MAKTLRDILSPSNTPARNGTALDPAVSGPGTPVGNLADALARELKIHPVTSPFLQKCLCHMAGVLHPTHGVGGELMFEFLATISRAVLDSSAARYGQINPEDEAVICGGSPSRLIRWYRTQIPGCSFNKEAALQCATQSNPDGFWDAREEEFVRHHLGTRRFLTDSTITTLAVLRAVPARLLAGLSDDDIRRTADEIAAAMTRQGFPVSLLSHSEFLLLLGEVRGGPPPAAAG